MNFWANALYWANTILGKCIILGEYNIGRIQYWANAILGEYNIGQIQYWANTILGECDSPLQLSPRIRRGVSHTPIYIRPIAYAQNYIITTLHVMFFGLVVWFGFRTKT